MAALVGAAFRENLVAYYPKCENVAGSGDPAIWIAYVGMFRQRLKKGRAQIWARLNPEAPLGIEFVAYKKQKVVHVCGGVPLRDLMDFGDEDSHGRKTVALREIMASAHPDHADRILTGMMHAILSDATEQLMPYQWFDEYVGDSPQGLVMKKHAANDRPLDAQNNLEIANAAGNGAVDGANHGAVGGAVDGPVNGADHGVDHGAGNEAAHANGNELAVGNDNAMQVGQVQQPPRMRFLPERFHVMRPPTERVVQDEREQALRRAVQDDIENSYRRLQPIFGNYQGYLNEYHQGQWDAEARVFSVFDADARAVAAEHQQREQFRNHRAEMEAMQDQNQAALQAVQQQIAQREAEFEEQMQARVREQQQRLVAAERKAAEEQKKREETEQELLQRHGLESLAAEAEKNQSINEWSGYMD